MGGGQKKSGGPKKNFPALCAGNRPPLSICFLRPCKRSTSFLACVECCDSVMTPQQLTALLSQLLIYTRQMASPVVHQSTCNTLRKTHRRRSCSGWSGNSGGCMASAEGWSVPSGVGYGDGYPLPSPLADYRGSRGEPWPMSSPSGIRGKSPVAETDFGVGYFEDHRTLIFVPVYDKI